MKKEPIKKSLFDILACPMCKGNLIYNKIKTKLICNFCKKEYKIKEGIPILLPK